MSVLGIGWDVGGWCGNSQGFALAAEGSSKVFEVIGKPLKTSFSLEDVNIPPEPVSFFQSSLKLSDKQEHRLEQADSIVLAVDAPLSWPSQFREFLTKSPSKKLDWDQKSSAHIDSPFYFRDCERWIESEYNKKPQPAVGSWIGNNAVVAQVLIQQWRSNQNWSVCPLDKSVSELEEQENAIIEVYPGTLKPNDEKDEEPYKNLLPDMEYDGGDDRYDAMICALHALGLRKSLPNIGSLLWYEEEIESGIGRELTADPQDSFPREEGWIYTFRNID